MAIPIPGMIAATRAVMAAKKAGSLVNQGKKFNKLQKANLGIGVPAAVQVRQECLMIVKCK